MTNTNTPADKSDWKEQLNYFQQPVYAQELAPFISEVIGKLLDQIWDEYMGTDLKPLKQQLRNKYL